MSEARWACIIGLPVRHSLSPALHNAAFEALGIAARYDAREVKPVDVEAAIAALRDPRCLGANVTAPHKQAVMPFLDQLSDEARTLGAVNTIVNRGGILGGDNTDALGLVRWMSQVGIDVAGQEAVVLGAGGAARAATLALARLGARRVLVLNRTREKADRLVDDLRPHACGASLEAGDLTLAGAPTVAPAGAVVNATSLGHHGGAPEVHPTWYTPGSTAIELVYNPPITQFMKDARRAGARVENGLGMLLYQAVLAFERWTGHTPPIDVYERAATAALEGVPA